MAMNKQNDRTTMPVITAFIVVLLHFPLTSSTPELSCTLTKDVTFHCNMGGFTHPLSSLLSLQIVKLAASKSEHDAVIATVDSGKAWLAQGVIEEDERKHYVSGQLDLSSKGNAWLKLMITDFTEDKYGNYSCQIHYTDHPADTKHSTWSKDVLVDESVSETASSSGFKITFSKGVHIVCDSGVLDETDGWATQMNISALESERYASWCEKTNESKCSSKLLGAYHRRRRSATEDTLQVHIPDVTCSDQANHTCTVITSSGKTLESSPKRLPLEDCQQEPKTEALSSTASPTVARPTTVEQDDSKVVFYVAPAIVVFIVLVSVAMFCCCRKQLRNSHDKSVNKTRLWMINWCCANKSIQAEEIDNLQNTSLVKIRSQKCPSGATEQPLLSCNETEGKSNTDGLALDLLDKLEEKHLGTKSHVDQIKSDTVESSYPQHANERNSYNFLPEECVIDVHENIAYERSQSSDSDSSHSSESSADCEGVSEREIKTPVQASQSPEEVVIV
ncbi:hypothetical protein V1264_003606 [Littorina saxatilis]|uniref:Ig-like domain-containing protein n=1 Tax=Littorina saxatilis TaxID=31220 RepID=A0AAN9B6D9_9CAEN